MKWSPSENDMLWLAQTLDMLQDGGSLAFPDAMLVFSVNKKDRKLLLLNPEVLSMAPSRQTFERTKIVALLLAYEVIIKQ